MFLARLYSELVHSIRFSENELLAVAGLPLLHRTKLGARRFCVFKFLTLFYSARTRLSRWLEPIRWQIAVHVTSRYVSRCLRLPLFSLLVFSTLLSH